MNNVHAEEQRNVQSALLYGNALHLFYLFHTFQVEQSAHLATTYLFSYVAAFGFACHDLTRNGTVQLSQFFL